MLLTTTIFVFATVAGWFPTTTYATARSFNAELVVKTVPDHVRPYVVRAYSLEGVMIGAQTYYFPVTGPSSDNAFTLQITTGGVQGSLQVIPHVHERHWENFFCVRGRTQLWVQKDDGSDEQQGRLLYEGDYGAVPINTRHTFQFLEPYTELAVPIQPGGFEALYYNLSDVQYKSGTESPYLLSDNYQPVLENATASDYNALEIFDVYARRDFQPRRDFVNGTAPASGTWHNGPNTLATDAETPYFVAKDYGPKYLSSAAGFYEVIQPIVTPIQSEGNLTFGTINLSRRPRNCTLPIYNFTGHSAYEALEGQVIMTIGNQTVEMTTGDVAFVPAGTDFSYHSNVAFTKMLYIAQGNQTLDQKLLATAKVWESPVWPATYMA